MEHRRIIPQISALAIIFNNMKKQIFFLICFLISFSLWAQFSTQTELKYLQIINADKNKELIKNNLWNAELKADSILYSKQQKLINRLFFIELAKSYFILKQYDLALLNLYKQRILFPSDSLSVENKQLFFELIYRNNFGDSISQEIWKTTEEKSLSDNYNERLNFLLKQAIDIHSKRLIPYIFNLAHLYERFSVKKPLWLNNWEFLSLIKIREKHKKQIIDYSNNQEQTIYKLIKNDKLKYKVYRKAIKHYIRINAIKRTKELINEYQTYDLPKLLKVDLAIKKARTKIKSLF
jgi:hypothetical protein